MKNLSICFLAVLTGVIISCGEKQSKSKVEILADFDYKTEFAGSDYSNAGGFITRDSALAKVKRGRALGQQNNQNYGFVIGLDTLREYIARIDSVNKLATNPDSVIQAVRVYLVTSFKKKPVNPGKPKEYLDIMIVPVLADGKNYHDVNDPGIPFQEDYPGYLNATLPCPEQCP